MTPFKVQIWFLLPKYQNKLVLSNNYKDVIYFVGLRNQVILSILAILFFMFIEYYITYGWTYWLVCTMNTTIPTARSTFSFSKFCECTLNMMFSCLRLLNGNNPTDPLIACKYFNKFSCVNSRIRPRNSKTITIKNAPHAMFMWSQVTKYIFSLRSKSTKCSSTSARLFFPEKHVSALTKAKRSGAVHFFCTCFCDLTGNRTPILRLKT